MRFIPHFVKYTVDWLLNNDLLGSMPGFMLADIVGYLT